MKKIILVLTCFILFLNAQTSLTKIDTSAYNTASLEKMLENGLYLSFLKEFNQKYNNAFVDEIYAELQRSASEFKVLLDHSGSTDIAIIIPEKTIRGYSNMIINASIAYLLRQKADIKMKVFLIGTEDESNIQNALKQIHSEGFRYAIAGFTLKGANYLASNNHFGLKVYLPILHKNNTKINDENIYFGSIDYDAQIKKLLSYGNSNIAIFSDNSALANNLTQKITNIASSKNIRTYTVQGEKINFRAIIGSQGSLSDATIFLNVPIVKTAILSSQFRVYNYRTYRLLITQIGYNPTLLSLSQTNDRKKMLIANSITNEDPDLSYLNGVFNQSINYNWVTYSTSIGLDYFYVNFLNQKSSRIFKEKMENSQVIYDIKLMKALDSSFEEQ